MTNFIKHSNETGSELGRGKKQLVPPPTGFTLLNILRIIWWYPHLITQATPHPSPLHTTHRHQHGSGARSQFWFWMFWHRPTKVVVVCSNNCHGNGQRIEEDLEMFIQPGNTLLPFSSNCSKSRCPLNINHNSSIISKIWIQFWKNDLAAWFMQGAIL